MVTGVLCSVSQGGLLGPLLINVFIGHVCYQRYFSAQLSSLWLYTDDTSAYASNTNISVLELSLNKDLENLSSWFASNYLSVDGKKTQVMILGKQSGYGFLNILGVHIDHKLSFLDHLSTFLKKVYSKVGALRRIRN